MTERTKCIYILDDGSNLTLGLEIIARNVSERYHSNSLDLLFHILHHFIILDLVLGGENAFKSCLNSVFSFLGVFTDPCEHPGEGYLASFVEVSNGFVAESVPAGRFFEDKDHCNSQRLNCAFYVRSLLGNRIVREPVRMRLENSLQRFGHTQFWSSVFHAGDFFAITSKNDISTCPGLGATMLTAWTIKREAFRIDPSNIALFSFPRWLTITAKLAGVSS
jgi:hypothetical protein